MVPSSIDPYGFDPVFERAAVTLACANRSFYGRIGHELDPELLGRDTSKLALRAARAVAKDLDHGPGSTLLVIQRIRRWVGEGKVTLDALIKVSNMFDRAEDRGLPEVDAVITELTPVIATRIRNEGVHSAIDSFGKGGDLRKVVQLEERAARVGQVDTDLGVVFGKNNMKASWEEMAHLRAIERLRLGIPEVDATLDGGLQRGGLGVLLAASGGGKSIGLNHISAVNVLDGLLVAYATLELPPGVVLARTKAAMTGIPTNVLLQQGETKAVRRLFRKLAPTMGHILVKYFTPLVTTIVDIFDWLKRIQDKLKRKVDLLVVDYGDKVGTKGKGKDDSGYSTGLAVFEGLRHYAHDEAMFTWTAAQATRQKDKRKRLDLDDVADSMHKVRVADLIITLNTDETDPEAITVSPFIAKHRTGVSRVSLGPFPVAWDRGQLIAI